MKYKLAALVLILFFIKTTGLFAQSLNDLYKESVKAYETKDYPKFKEKNLACLAIHPSQPTLLYNTAAAYSLLEKKDSSLFFLHKLISWNAELDITKDQDFAYLLADVEAIEKMAEWKNAYSNTMSTVGTENEISTLFHAEDVTFFQGAYWMTDVQEGKVYKMEKGQRRAEKVVKLPACAMAITTDGNNQLYVTTAMMPQYHRFDSTRENTAYLYQIQPSDYQVIRTLEFPAKSVIGSLVMGPGGKLYGSNSIRSVIAEIDPENGTITEHEVPGGRSLQGIVYDPEINLFYVADYIMGVKMIPGDNLSGGQWMRSPEYLLKGIDGMILSDKGALYAIQNSSTPKRLIQIKHEGTQVNDVLILENTGYAPGEPTNGRWISGSGLVYILNSPWPLYQRDGSTDRNTWPSPLLKTLVIE